MNCRIFPINLKFQVGPIPKSELYTEIAECEYVIRPAEATIWRIGGDLSFANYEDILHRLKKRIAKLPPRKEYKVVHPCPLAFHPK